MATQPQAQDDALMLEAAADRVNDEEQPDWDGIAELVDRVRAGKITMVAAMKELAMLVPEGRDVCNDDDPRHERGRRELPVRGARADRTEHDAGKAIRQHRARHDRAACGRCLCRGDRH
jgi:hypothetical protein